LIIKILHAAHHIKSPEFQGIDIIDVFGILFVTSKCHKKNTDMKKFIFKQLPTLFLLTLPLFIFNSCDDDDDKFAKVIITAVGSDLDGDVVGDGGSTKESYTLFNPFRTVDWNMDITAVRGGSFNLHIEDADGNTVLNQTLEAGKGEDSRSGLSRLGARGQWTVTITLSNFDGDGSFSISPEDLS